MFKKIELWIVLLIIIFGIIFSIFFGTLVRQELVGGVKLGSVSKAALFLSEIPLNLKKILSHDLVLSEDRAPEKSGFVGNNLKDLSYLLLSRYDGNLNESVVELVDLTSFEVVHRWNPDIKKINSYVDISKEEFKNHLRDNNERRYGIAHPIINSDGSIIFNDSSPLVKIDFCSNLIWQNQKDRFHHSNELDFESNIWVPSYIFPFTLDKKYIGEDIDKYYEDGITQISQDGNILFQKSLSELFIENNMKNRLFTIGEVNKFLSDPTHLNDIQPALFNSDFWKKGDIFLSLRNQSMIMLYRPSTNEVLWKSDNHISNQHDIDILDDHTISIFNNNTVNTPNGTIVDGNNEVIIYDFSSGKYSRYLNQSLIENDVRTITGGRSQIIDNGDLYIEETNSGRILYFDKSGKLEWEFINRADDKRVYLISWSRIIYNKDKIKEIKNLIETNTCYEN